MDEQVRMLRLTLDTMDEAHKAGRSASRELIDGYLTGDLDKLAAMSNDSMKGEPELQKKFMARALDGRNVVMVDRLLAKRASATPRSASSPSAPSTTPARKASSPYWRRRVSR